MKPWLKPIRPAPDITPQDTGQRNRLQRHRCGPQRVHL